MSVLKQQKEDFMLKEEKIRHYLGAVISVAEHISRERDQLLHMVLLMTLIMQNYFVIILVHVTHDTVNILVLVRSYSTSTHVAHPVSPRHESEIHTIII